MIYILLPAFNEEASLPSLMNKIEKAMEEVEGSYKVLICDDGSDDNTAELLKEYSRAPSVEFISHSLNRGLGETMRDLYEWVASIASDEDVVIRMDCDDTHEPKYIPNLINKVREGYDVVIASRFAEGGGQEGVAGYRAFISSCANLFMKVFFPIRGLREYSCGFRAYNAGIIRKAIDFYGNDFIQLKGLGFTCTLEKLVKFKLIEAKFAEIPFVLRYDQKLSDSKMVSSITTLGYLTMTLLYHWPWGGWRNSYGKKIAKHKLGETGA